MQDEGFEKRLRELSDRAYRESIYQFTDFLGLSEISCYLQIKRELTSSVLFGGTDDTERKMLRFGSQELFGYEEPFPICCMQAEPVSEKFAEDLTHRDVLGALMHLGIERSVIGDICIRDGSAYFFCVDRMKQFFCDELTRIRHTTVICREADQIPQNFSGEKKEVIIQAESERVDAVAAKVFHLSRSSSTSLFKQGRVFINGIVCEKSGRMLQENELVSVRGYGRFRFKEVKGLSRKGRKNIVIEI